MATAPTAAIVAAGDTSAGACVAAALSATEAYRAAIEALWPSTTLLTSATAATAAPPGTGLASPRSRCASNSASRMAALLGRSASEAPVDGAGAMRFNSAGSCIVPLLLPVTRPAHADAWLADVH